MSYNRPNPYGPPCWVDPCPSCPRKYRAIGGSGPQPAQILCIAERPGKTENDHGRVLIGKTGEEFDHTYLPLSGLCRSAIRTCNSCLCWADNNRTPTEKEVLSCAAHHIPQEIRDTQPEIIVLMGSSACKLLPAVRLEMMHGIPQHTDKVGELFGWSGWILPMYHPAMGLHESKWMGMILDDWEALGKLLGYTGSTGGWAHDPSEPDLKYELLYQELGGMHPRIAVDTEDHGGVPWSIQWSGMPNTGYMLRADDQRGIGKFAAWMREENPEVIFHHAAHDLDVLSRMGVEVRRFRDTMQEAYQLCNLPQGLKSLAYRLFRVTMTSWEDVVRPASIEKLQEWLTEAWVVASLDLKDKKVEIQKTCVCGHQEKAHRTINSIGPCLSSRKGKASEWCPCLMYTPRTKESDKASTVESLLTRLVRLTLVESEYDPWERLDPFWQDPDNSRYVSHLETRVGHYPILGIANASMDRAIRYSCLSAGSIVITEDGPKNIKDLVSSKYAGKVKSVSPEGVIGYKTVTGWHRIVNGTTGRCGGKIKWKSILTKTLRPNGRWKNTGARYTPDHRLLTPKGWVAIEDLKAGEELCLPIEELDSFQRQLVYGGMLGDACIDRRNEGGWASLRMTHCDKQKPYLEWKGSMLGILSSPIKKNKFVPGKKTWIADNWGQSTQSWTLTTYMHPTLSKLRVECYGEKPIGKRCCLKRLGTWIDQLDELGLAIWYQDDGSIVWEAGKKSGHPRFYTLNFSREECAKLCDILFNKFGLECSIFDMKGWAISINGKSAQAFYELIHRWVHPCMQYKLPPYWRDKFNPDKEPIHFGLVRDKITAVFDNMVTNRQRRGLGIISYCLDVEDWHNFCTMGEVAHNCGDADMTGRVAVELERRRNTNRFEIYDGDRDQ